MTREEAIKGLKSLVEVRRKYGDMQAMKDEIECLEMAIKALEQQPCEDCISRQAVIDAVGNMLRRKFGVGGDLAEITIAELPSVTPQPKTGRWLEKEVNSDKVIDEWQSARCSVCDKYHTTPYMYYFSRYNYCPHCGAKMEVEE